LEIVQKLGDGTASTSLTDVVTPSVQMIKIIFYPSLKNHARKVFDDEVVSNSIQVSLGLSCKLLLEKIAEEKEKNVKFSFLKPIKGQTYHKGHCT
jgi:hypothetical protein